MSHAPPPVISTKAVLLIASSFVLVISPLACRPSAAGGESHSTTYDTTTARLSPADEHRTNQIWTLGRNAPDKALDQLRRWEQSGEIDSEQLRNELQYIKADLLSKNGQYEEALDMMSQLVARAPRNGAYASMYAQMLATCDRNDEALAVVTRAVRAGFPYGAAHALRAELLMRRGKTHEALPEIEACKRLIKKGDAPLWMRVAQLYGRIGNDAAFEDALRRGRAEAPDDPVTYRVMGDVLVSLKRRDRAAQSYARSAELSRDARSYADLAFRLRHVGAVKLAKHYAQKAFAMDSNSWATAFALAESMAAEKRFEEALPYYSKSVELAPRETKLRVGRAECLIKLRRFTQALQDAESAVAIAPHRIDLVQLCVSIQYNLGHYTKAIELADQILSKHPDYAESYYLRARSLSALGNNWRAVEDFTAAEMASPDNSGYILSRAESLLALHLPDSALDDVNSVLRLHPKHFVALKVRSKIFQALGQSRLAQRDQLLAEELELKEQSKN